MFIFFLDKKVNVEYISWVWNQLYIRLLIISPSFGAIVYCGSVASFDIDEPQDVFHDGSATASLHPSYETFAHVQRYQLSPNTIIFMEMLIKLWIISDVRVTSIHQAGIHIAWVSVCGHLEFRPQVEPNTVHVEIQFSEFPCTNTLIHTHFMAPLMSRLSHFCPHQTSSPLHQLQSSTCKNIHVLQAKC